MKTDEYDFLIIGLGLAGTVLSHELIQKGNRVFVFDDNEKNSSSRVAGGMFNPVVFKRMTKAWRSGDFLPIALKFYHKMEEHLEHKLVHYRNIVRLFPDQESANNFDVKSVASGFDDLLSTDSIQEIDENISTPFGYGCVKNGGYLDTKKLLDLYRKKLTQNNQLCEDMFDDEKLVISDYGVEYEGVKAKKIIFCRGHHDLSSKYFSYLPFRRAKGEVLIVELLDKKFTTIINNGKFLIPLQGEYLIGSNYIWDTLDLKKSEKTKKNFLEKMIPIIGENITIKEHRAGIRPTVKDRRPLIGWHPTYQSIGIFNGLGTRGVMIAPSCASNFTASLNSDQELMKECNVERYADLWESN